MSGSISNCLVDPVQVLWKGTDLGLSDGDIEPKIDLKFHELMAHQQGGNLLDMIRIGKLLTLPLKLQEVSLAQIKSMMPGGALATATAEVTSITCVADVSGSLNNKYFYIYNALDAIPYYVWFNVNSAGTAPAPSGKTAVEIAIATNATAATVATAVAAALDALAGFIASAASGVVTCTNAVVGYASDAVDVNSGVTISVTTQGAAAASFGYGSSKDFASCYADAGVLTLHPVGLAASDHTRDLNFWKAYPVISGIAHSGEKNKLVTVEFKIFVDSTRPVEINLFAFGDPR